MTSKDIKQEIEQMIIDNRDIIINNIDLLKAYKKN